MAFRRIGLAALLCIAAGGLAAGERGFGLQAGAFLPGPSARDELFVGKGGYEVGLSLAQSLGRRLEARAEGAYAVCRDGHANRCHAPWEQHGGGYRPARASLDRFYLGLGLRSYLGEGRLRPFLSVGLGGYRLSSRVERFVPRDLASCHRQNHHHPEVRPWSGGIKGHEPRNLGPRSHCGHMESVPLRSTGWKLGFAVGAGCVLGDRMEVALRHELTPAYGRTLGAWTLSAGVRF